MSRRQGYSQQSTPLMGRTIPGPLSCSGRNPWQFPGSVLQVQSCHCVCVCVLLSCPALSIPHPLPHPAPKVPKASQHSTTTWHVCWTHHLGFSYTTLLDLASNFRDEMCHVGGVFSERESSKKMGMLPLLDMGTHLRCSAPRAVISAI